MIHRLLVLISICSASFLFRCGESGLTAPEACRHSCHETCAKHGACDLLQLDPDETVSDAVDDCVEDCIPQCDLVTWSCPEEKDTADACREAISSLSCEAYEDYLNQSLIPAACVSPCTDR